MNKLLILASVVSLGACVYGTPVNNERLYGNSDLSKIDWAAVNRSGSSCQTNWFGFLPFGDNSVPTAIRVAGINSLAYVDTDTAVYFPLFSRDCTNVWGSTKEYKQESIKESKPESVGKLSDYAQPAASTVSQDSADVKTKA